MSVLAEALGAPVVPLSSRPGVGVVRDFTHETVIPSLDLLSEVVGLRQQLVSREAVVNLVCISLQETLITHRRQLVRTSSGLQPVGRGRGLWQFEKPTIRLTLEHSKTRKLQNYQEMIQRFFPASEPLEDLIVRDDTAACILARLLLWTDHRTLTLDPDQMYQVYDSVWRPSAKRPHDWRPNWDLAMAAYPERPLIATKRALGLSIAGAATVVQYGPQIVDAALQVQTLALPEWARVAAGCAQALGIILTTLGTTAAFKRNGG